MLNKMKYFVIGLAFGIITSGGIGFAEESFLKVSKMDCNIIANGKEINMDLPILNFEGRSYFPLRSVADITGDKIEWKADTKTINYDSVIRVETRQIVKEVPKEIIKEVPVEKIVEKEIIKEVPKEVIKEVVKYIEPEIKTTIIDGEYFVKDINSSGSGFIFIIDPVNGNMFEITKKNGLDIYKNFYYRQTNQPSTSNSNNSYSNQQLYNTEYQRLTNQYNDSINKVDSDTSSRISKQRELFNSYGWTENNSSMVTPELEKIKQEGEESKNTLKRNYDIDVQKLKALYGIQ